MDKSIASTDRTLARDTLADSAAPVSETARLRGENARLTAQLAETADQSAALKAELEAALLRIEERRQERRALDREVVELRSLLQESERQLANVRQTFMYRIGETIVSARTWKGLRDLPRRLYQLRQAYLAKRRGDGGFSGEEKVAVRLRYVDEALRIAAREGLEAAAAFVREAPGAQPREQARALVELAQTARLDHPEAAGALGAEAAGLNPSEMRLRALAMNLFEDGAVAGPAAILEASPEVLSQPNDRHRREAMLAHGRLLAEPFRIPPRASTAVSPERVVAVVTPRSLPHHAEPVSYRAEAVVEAIVADGREAVFVTAPGYRHRQGYVGLLPEPSNGRMMLRLPAPSAPPLTLDLFIADSADQLEAAFQNQRIDSVHIIADGALAVAALMAAHRVGAPATLDVGALPGHRERITDRWARTERHAVNAALFAEAVRAADRVVARSRALADRLKADFGRADVIIAADAIPEGHHRADEAAIADARRELEVGDGPLIGIFEALDGDEGLADAVRALPIVLKSVPEARLVLLGAGPGAQSLRLLAAQLGVGGRVVIPNGFSRQRAGEYLSAFDIALFPKRRVCDMALTAPFELRAAMAVQTPVVAADTAWARELLNGGGRGLCYPAGDAQALAQAVARLLNDPAEARRLAQTAAAHVAV